MGNNELTEAAYKERIRKLYNKVLNTPREELLNELNGGIFIDMSETFESMAEMIHNEQSAPIDIHSPTTDEIKESEAGKNLE